MSDQNWQDWKTVVVGKSKSKTGGSKTSNVATERRYGAGKNTQTSAVNARKIEEGAIPDKVSRELGKRICELRVAKKLTQDDLNKIAQLPIHTIRDWENGSAVYNSTILQKIGKALGTTLKKTGV